MEKPFIVSPQRRARGAGGRAGRGCGCSPRARRGASIGPGHRRRSRHRQDPPGAEHRRQRTCSRRGGVLRPGPSFRADTSVRCDRRGAGSEPALTGPAQGRDRRAAGRPGGGGPARPAGDIQYRVVEQIVDLVETSCAERPVLLVAEDLHWADSASLLAILSVDAAAAACGVACRGDSPTLAAAGRGGPAPRRSGGRRRAHLRLQPLRPDDVAALAAARCWRTAPVLP